MPARKLLIAPLFLAVLALILCPKLAAPQEAGEHKLPTISARFAWQSAYFIDDVQELDGAEPVDITGDFVIGDPITSVKPDVEELAQDRPELLARLEEMGHIPMRAILDRTGRVTNARFEEEVEPEVRDLFLEILREARFEPTVHYERGPVFVVLSIEYRIESKEARRPDPPARSELVGEEGGHVLRLLDESGSGMTRQPPISYARILSRAEAPILDPEPPELVMTVLVTVDSQGTVREIDPPKGVDEGELSKNLLMLLRFIESFRFEPIYLEDGLAVAFKAFVELTLDEGQIRIATRTNPAEVEARVADVYYLDPAKVLDLLPPPYPPERMVLYQTEAPSQSRTIPSGPNQMRIHWKDDRPTYGGACFGGCNSLENLFGVLGVPRHAIRLDPALRDVRVQTDVLFRPDAPTDELLADLEAALLEQFGLDLRFDLRSEVMPTLVVRGSFGEVAEDPDLKLPTVHFFTDRRNPEPNVGAGAGPLTELGGAIELLEGQLGIFVVDETEGGLEKPTLIQVHDSAFGTERLELLIRNVEAQTDLEISVQDRLQEVLYVTQRSGT
jgi:hypothetical protein